MTTLERHCQLLLLLAYPAAYREVRGEEIVGTLLEATPPERSWPLLRDSRGLIAGGLRARAALNRHFTTTAANLRTALLAGIAAYLTCYSAAVVGSDVLEELPRWAQHLDWPQLIAPGLILVTVLLAWLGGRRMIVLAGALPAAVALCFAGSWHPRIYVMGLLLPTTIINDLELALGDAVVPLVFVAALVALSDGRELPSRRWLVPIGLIALVRLLVNLDPQVGLYVFQTLELTIAAAAIVWAVIDARPAIAVSVFVLGLWLPTAVHGLAQGMVPAYVWPYLAITTAIAVPAVWLLRRQSAHPGRPTRT